MFTKCSPQRWHQKRELKDAREEVQGQVRDTRSVEGLVSTDHGGQSILGLSVESHRTGVGREEEAREVKE